MPSDLQDQLADLEEWAVGNARHARVDAISYWILKIPAIVASASAGIWAHFELTTVTLIAGAIASLCVIVDGMHPRGMLRNTHLRAAHDIRILASTMKSEWRTRSKASPDTTAKKIIQGAEPERQRIAKYIRDAETALNAGKDR